MNEQPPKPNFDFIVNQQLPEQQKPKGNKKLFIVLASAAVFLIALTAFAVLFTKKATNVQQSAVGKTESAQFLTYIADNNADAAYNMLKPIAQLDKDFFTNDLVKPYSERFALKSCSLQQNGYQVTDTEAKLTYDCPFKDKKNGDHVTLAITVDRKTSKIAKIEMVTSKS